MEGEDRAPQFTEYATVMWVLVCFMAAVALLGVSLNVWDQCHLQSLTLMKKIIRIFGLVYCLLPLLSGFGLKRILKKELDRELLSARIFKICDYWIALLLLFVYMGIINLSNR